MLARYDPAAPNPWFAPHKYRGIPLNRNLQPIGQGKLLHRVGPAATVEKAIAVPILTPAHLWRTFQTEAEDILTVDGSLEGNERARALRINAAYAKLWLADNRFQWAGFIAFASRQVGCGLLHLAETIAKDRQQRMAVQRSIAAAMGMGASAAQGMAYLYRKLDFGNAQLFLEMYPLHRLFMERGWEEFSACLPHRQSEHPDPAVDGTRLSPQQDVRDAFALVEAGNLALGADRLVRHEQAGILQAVMYADPVLQKLLALNQYAWATRFPTGDLESIELTLSAECKAGLGARSWLRRAKPVQLWAPEQRMLLALDAASQFHALLHGPERPYVEASLRAIAAA